MRISLHPFLILSDSLRLQTLQIKRYSPDSLIFYLKQHQKTILYTIRKQSLIKIQKHTMTYKALVQYQTGNLPILEERPIPEPKEGHLLIKVEASTVNPVDRLKLDGVLFTEPLPAVLGFEGVGRVVKANGEKLQEWVGKRVTFLQVGSGSWAEYSITNPLFAVPITEEVSVESAASGLINPLTTVGITDTYLRFPHKNGIIHTAAASALGRMLNKRCIRLGIPLLNVVRRQEQADILRSQGAQHVIITQGNWHAQYANYIEKYGFNVIFDALGGGSVSQTLILGLKPNSAVHIYGHLAGQALKITEEVQKERGTAIKDFNFFAWYTSISEQEREQVKKEHNDALKSELSTKSYKTLPFSKIGEAIELSISKANEGKITLIPE